MLKFCSIGEEEKILSIFKINYGLRHEILIFFLNIRYEFQLLFEFFLQLFWQSISFFQCCKKLNSSSMTIGQLRQIAMIGFNSIIFFVCSKIITIIYLKMYFMFLLLTSWGVAWVEWKIISYIISLNSP